MWIQVNGVCLARISSWVHGPAPQRITREHKIRTGRKRASKMKGKAFYKETEVPKQEAQLSKMNRCIRSVDWKVTVLLLTWLKIKGTSFFSPTFIEDTGNVAVPRVSSMM